MDEDKVRLQKWLASLGIASRREAESWIEAGRVAVNGRVARLGDKILPGEDQVTLDGRLIAVKTPPKVYWLLNKPDQVLTTRSDVEGRATIYDLPKLRGLPYRVSPVGRLDYRTEGLLLLTNDGELANRLMHPRYRIPRRYYALINGKLEPEQLKALRRGIELEDGPTGPIGIEPLHGKRLGATKGRWYEVTVHEGRNRFVRRLFESMGHKVVRLIRFAYAHLELPEDLRPGDYLQLGSDDIAKLKKAVELA